MPKQIGIFKIEGTIGDVTFYKGPDGHLVRGKGGVSKDRIKNDDSFERTRENNSEFGRAGSAGKLLRVAFKNYLQNATDSKTVSRLTKKMIEVVKADATSTRGQRNVLDGELELLQGFEFNIDSELSQTVSAPYTANIDRVTGQATVNIPPFVPGKLISAPTGATHFQLISAAAEIDFEKNIFNVVNAEGDHISLDIKPTQQIDLACALPANSTHPLFLVLGIAYNQEVNGEMYELKNGNFNSLAFVKILGL